MKFKVFLISVLMVAGGVACKQHEKYEQADYSGDYQVDNKEQVADEAPPPPGNEGINIERKLIKQGNLEYKVDNLSTARKQILTATAKWKGYVSNETEYNTADRFSTTLTIRVPSASFDSLLMSATLDIAHFDRKEIQVSDVTEEYVDIEARLKTKRELEERYLSLLKKAGTVQEILEIEKEIGVLRADIESIEGRLNVLKNQVAFSTLTITIYETVSAPSFFGERWVNSLGEGWDNLLDFLVGISSLWPFLLLGTGAYVGVKRWRRRKNAGK